MWELAKNWLGFGTQTVQESFSANDEARQEYMYTNVLYGGMTLYVCYYLIV